MILSFKSPPLENFLLKSTSKAEDLHGHISSVLTAHRAKKTSLSSRNAKAAVLHHAPLPNSSFNYLFYGAETKVEVSQLGFFLIEIPLSGMSVTRCGDGSVVSGLGQAVIAGPYHQFSTDWSEDCSKLLIKIECNAFENYLSTLLRRKQMRILDFEMAIDLNADSSQSLLRIIYWIIAELEHSGSSLNANPFASVYCEQALMWCLLHTQPNNYTEELNRMERPGLPEFIIKTKQYIEENYAEPITLEILVHISKVSERLLLEGYRKHLGISPMKQLKHVRLERVHLMLKEMSPEMGNVTEIGLAAGFTQLGKFSGEYKERFGELPSETLKTISPIGF